MKKEVLDHKIERLLNEFERTDLKDISADWDTGLAEKLLMAKQHSGISFTKPVYASAFLGVFLINAVFAFKIISVYSTRAALHGGRLQVISKELLINPLSIDK
jgi:hypothetical protein